MLKSESSLPARYVVGVDLGTTNCAVCFVDTGKNPSQIQTFRIPQLVAPDLLESRDTLPSFHYQPTDEEFVDQIPKRKKTGNKKAGRYLVGTFARDHGAKVSGRLVSSAKSWLSHSGVDRTAPLLPWHGAEDVEKLSPVEVSSRYLEHIRTVWDTAHPQEPLDRQDIVLTLPASFDEVARELTISAAKLAGLPKIVLLEEPQAAFYAWIHDHRAESEIHPGQKILVCDIGGGTTDLTLIRVKTAENGKLRFHRVAVGEHLILGGDNFDFTLAHHLQKRLVQEQRIPKNEETEGGTKLPARLWFVLVRLCCQVKELMLGLNAQDSTTLHLPGFGSKLIGGSVQIEISRQEVHDLLVEGFLPQVALDSKPTKSASGFREFGLPFASDAAITRHLAQFLSVHRHSGEDAIEDRGQRTEDRSAYDPARPDMVLFNGGVFEAAALKQRLISVLEDWFNPTDRDPRTKIWSPKILENPQLYLAVARGAAYYGMVRRGAGERINASLARTYYIGVENPDDRSVRAVCLLPASTEPDHEIALDQPRFELRIGTPISFPLYVSSLRLTDQPGETLEIEPEQLTSLPPIRTVLKSRRKKQEMIHVRILGKLTEIGTLELAVEEIPERITSRRPLNWRLEFDVRSTTQTDILAHESDAEQDGFLDESTWEEMKNVLTQTFGLEDRGQRTEDRKEITNYELRITDNTDRGKVLPFDASLSSVLCPLPSLKIKPSELIRKLLEVAPMEREDWPTSLLRRIGECLMDLESGRKLSAEHEARWLNLLGYAYRPGFGFAMDDYRIDRLWKTLQGTLVHKSPAVSVQWWVLLRRISGGLTIGQQQSLCEPILGNIRALYKQLIDGRGRGCDLDLTSQEGAEIWRMIGSMELLAVATKIELGDMIGELVLKKRMDPVYDAMIWTLGRLGARHLLYGPLNAVVPSQSAVKWIHRRIKDSKTRPIDPFTLMELARKTDDRYRDVPETVREEVLRYLRKISAPDHFARLVREAVGLDTKEETLVFGESLPVGLRLAR